MKGNLMVNWVIAATLALKSLIPITNAAWDQLLPISEGLELNGMAVSEDGTALAVGQFGLVLSYHGMDWNQIETPFTDDLNDIFSFGSKTVAVGDHGLIAFYDGSDWSIVQQKQDYDLKGVWGWSPEDIYAVGEGGRILHYDGDQWTPKASGTETTLNTVWGCDSVIIAAGDEGVLLKNEAGQWQQINTASSNTFYDVWVSSDGVLFAAGADMILYGSILSASFQRYEYDVNVTAIWGRSSEDVFAAGRGFSGSYNGIKWTQDSGASEIFPYEVNSIHGNSGSQVFAAGDRGCIWRHDSSQWEDDISRAWLSEVHGNSDDGAYVVSSSGTILHFDGEKIQRLETGITTNLTAIHVFSADSIFVAGADGVMGHWDGEEWIWWQMDVGIHWSDLDGIDPDNMVVGGYEQDGSDWIPHFMQWDGSDWTPLACPISGHFYSRLVMAANGDIYFAGHDGLIRFDGVNWTNLVENIEFTGIWYLAPDDLYLTSYQWISNGLDYEFYPEGKVHHWDGSELTEIYKASGVDYCQFQSIAGNSKDDFWVLGYGSFFRWDGSNWEFGLIPGVPSNIWVNPVMGVLVSGYNGSLCRFDQSQELTTKIITPGTQIHTGDSFFINVDVQNDSGMNVHNAQMVFILDVFEQYWFWPQWHEVFDYSSQHLMKGSNEIEILPSFTWPDAGSDSVAGLRFWAAVLEDDLSTLLGSYDMLQWGYGPKH